MISRALILTASVALLAACDSEPAKPPAKQVAGPPVSFPAGQWEVTALTQKVQAKDRFAPQTRETVGKSTTRKLCSPAGPAPAFALFADQGADCTSVDDYARRGRLNMTFSCKRPGLGQVNISLDGDYTADSFVAGVIAASSFAGQGDYTLTQKVTGKRIGECPAGKAPN